jgi:Tol biopolymer transport system component
LPPPLTTGWTPDARAIVASWTGRSSTAFALTLWAASADAAERPAKILLEDDRFNLWEGQFSPNGRWMSFVAESLDETDRVRIFIAPAAGAPRAQWLPIAGDLESPDKPRWSADGRTLYFLSRRSAAFFNLWAVHIDPEGGKAVGQPFVLTHFDSPSRMISPNIDKTELGIGAGRAMLNLRTVTGNVWMLDHVDR